MTIRDIVIIGAGPAGLTSSIYLARAGFNPYILTGSNPGGQLINTSLIENYPGFDVPINGADLMAKMISQAENYNVEFNYEEVIAISKEENFKIKTNLNILESRSILIATGATHKKLNIPGEIKFTNHGVSWCATCDGPMYKGKKVAVVGGGNTAVMEAIFLSNFADVKLIHRRDSLRADKTEQEKLFSKKNIEIIWNSEVTEICGNNNLKSINIFNNKSQETKSENIDGLFIAIGTNPVSDLVKDLVELDPDGYIITNESATTCPGIFAAGDVVSGSLKQAIYAAGQGALAASKIGQFLG